MGFGLFCLILGTLITVVSMWFALKCGQKHDNAGKHLRNVFVLVAVVSISYLISVQMQAKQAFAIFSAIYYCGIDLMLYFLLRYSVEFVKLDTTTRWYKAANVVLLGILLFDIAAELTSPFFGYYAVDFTVSAAGVPYYQYVLKTLFALHLSICYALIVIFAVLFIGKCFLVPKEYRYQYILSLGGRLRS